MDLNIIYKIIAGLAAVGFLIVGWLYVASTQKAAAYKAAVVKVVADKAAADKAAADKVVADKAAADKAAADEAADDKAAADKAAADEADWQAKYAILNSEKEAADNMAFDNAAAADKIAFDNAAAWQAEYNKKAALDEALRLKDLADYNVHIANFKAAAEKAAAEKATAEKAAAEKALRDEALRIKDLADYNVHIANFKAAAEKAAADKAAADILIAKNRAEIDDLKNLINYNGATSNLGIKTLNNADVEKFTYEVNDNSNTTNRYGCPYPRGLTTSDANETAVRETCDADPLCYGYYTQSTNPTTWSVATKTDPMFCGDWQGKVGDYPVYKSKASKYSKSDNVKDTKQFGCPYPIGLTTSDSNENAIKRTCSADPSCVGYYTQRTRPSNWSIATKTLPSSCNAWLGNTGEYPVFMKKTPL